jgi:hypothetical protein
MKTSVDVTPALSDESMFGCECALPFLSPTAGGVSLGAASVMALGALMSLGACDAAPPNVTRHEVADKSDKVSAAIDKIDRQFDRAKARFRKDERPIAPERAESQAH